MTSLAVAHLSRRYRFAASHRLHVGSLTAEQNRELFGKCNNPYGHGHNYAVQVTLRGPVDPATGMVVNLADLDAFARRDLLDGFDRRNLNEHPAFRSLVPSTENLCRVLWNVFWRFAQQHPTVRLERIRVEETRNNAFDYFGDGTPAAAPDRSFNFAERPANTA